MTDLDRQANVLGALSLVVHDRTRDAVAAAVGEARAETAAAALSALYHFLDRPNIDMLRQVLGLTPSGAVRLVDRLVDAGFVTRDRSGVTAAGSRQVGDRRSRVITLTPAGRHAAEQVAEARADVLLEALDPLTDAERATFEQLIGRVLAGLGRGPGATRWICRLCDTDACERREGKCPIARAAANRYGAAAVYGDRPAPS